MKTFKPRKTAWHYKLLNYLYLDGLLDKMPEDFCSYWRTVSLMCLSIAALFITTLIIAGSAIFIISAFGFIITFSAMSSPLKFLIFILVASAAGYFYYRRKHCVPKKETDYETSMIKMKYDAWKEKYCPKVDYN